MSDFQLVFFVAFTTSAAYVWGKRKGYTRAMERHHAHTLRRMKADQGEGANAWGPYYASDKGSPLLAVFRAPDPINEATRLRTLEQQRIEAEQAEDYELAAVLRDKIKAL